MMLKPMRSKPMRVKPSQQRKPRSRMALTGNCWTNKRRQLMHNRQVMRWQWQLMQNRQVRISQMFLAWVAAATTPTHDLIGFAAVMGGT